MAGEPSIELTGYAGEIKDFQDSSILTIYPKLMASRGWA